MRRRDASAIFRRRGKEVAGKDMPMHTVGLSYDEKGGEKGSYRYIEI